MKNDLRKVEKIFWNYINEIKGEIKQPDMYLYNLINAYVAFMIGDDMYDRITGVIFPEKILDFILQKNEQLNNTRVFKIFENNLKRNPQLIIDLLILDKNLLAEYILSYRDENNPRLHEETPSFIIKLANKILNIKEDDQVIDLNSNNGEYLIQTSKQYDFNKFALYEENIEKRIISKIKIDVLNEMKNKEVEVNVYEENVFEKKNIEEYDKAFVQAPFRVRATREEKNNFIKLNPFLNNIWRGFNLDWIYMFQAIKSIKKDGKAVAVSIPATSYNANEVGFRKFLIQEGLIEAIITLPERLFDHTMIQTMIYVLSYGNKEVKMIDASNEFTAGRRRNSLEADNINTIYKAYLNDSEISKTVSVENIIDKMYNLTPNRYLEDISYDNGVKLREVVEVKRGSMLNARELDELSSEQVTNYQYLMLGDIENGLINEDLNYLTNIDEGLSRYLIKDKDLIISKIGSPFKVAVYEEKNKDVLANGNLYILSVNKDKIDSYYLQAYLQSDQGQKALELLSSGTTFSSLAIRDLEQVEIPLPNLKKQQEIGNLFKSKLSEISKANELIEDNNKLIAKIFNEREED